MEGGGVYQDKKHDEEEVLEKGEEFEKEEELEEDGMEELEGK